MMLLMLWLFVLGMFIKMKFTVGSNLKMVQCVQHWQIKSLHKTPLVQIFVFQTIKVHTKEVNVKTLLISVY